MDLLKRVVNICGFLICLYGTCKFMAFIFINPEFIDVLSVVIWMGMLYAACHFSFELFCRGGEKDENDEIDK